MDIKFKTNLFIDGMEYEKGKTYNIANEGIARAFISSGYAEVPGINVLGGETKRKPPAKKPAKKPAKGKK